MTPLLHGTRIVQNAYVVRDLEAACARLHGLYGIGPFLGGQRSLLEDHVYRGRPAPPIAFRPVFFQSGDLCIELIELQSDGPSAFHDMYPDGGEGIHHVAIFCEDYAATRDGFAARGYPVATEFAGRFGGSVCYIDTRAALGHMIELYPENPGLRGLYARTRAAARDWDGKQLIIPWN